MLTLKSETSLGFWAIGWALGNWPTSLWLLGVEPEPPEPVVEVGKPEEEEGDESMAAGEFEAPEPAFGSPFRQCSEVRATRTPERERAGRERH